MILVVDHQQLLDPPLVQDAPRDFLAGAEADRREIVLVISSLTGWLRDSRRSGRRGW